MLNHEFVFRRQKRVHFLINKIFHIMRNFLLLKRAWITVVGTFSVSIFTPSLIGSLRKKWIDISLKGQVNTIICYVHKTNEIWYDFCDKTCLNSIFCFQIPYLYKSFFFIFCSSSSSLSLSLIALSFFCILTSTKKNINYLIVITRTIS